MMRYAKYKPTGLAWLPEVPEEAPTLPPLAEQREIVAYIEAKVAKIDAAVRETESEIERLKEYRQRLISDVVTGQRKVVA